MARKAIAPVELVQDAALDVGALAVTQNLGAIAQGMQDERDLVNQLLGQVQMARSFARFADVVSLSKLAHIKETKMYRGLAGKKGVDQDGNEIADVGTWDGFCQALGLSRSKVDEDLINLAAFGEEALKQLSSIGAGYRDLRQWRRLPDDARSALIEAAKTDNKEAVIFLAEELIANHAKVEQKLVDTQADYEAQGGVLANKSAELDKTRQELEKVRRQVQTLTADERAKELRVEVAALAFEAEADITGKLREGFIKLAEHAEEHGVDHRPFKAAMVRQLEALLAAIRSEFHLPDASGEDEFPWLGQAAGQPLLAQDA
ncbi:hypothetical protein [Pseudomonas sp.]|uniref:hypothetical protein n=1 Tax=Pseudomonas sp. TaxID=306 RepID=UPI0027357DC1|nr:hypothetical protein [Pseudomonas sp.]MDP3816203.1 hypothetical protein [Pseudomonas sp.]